MTRVTDKTVPESVSVSDTVCQSPHVQLQDDQSQVTVSSSVAGHLLFSLVQSHAAQVKRKFQLSLIQLAASISSLTNVRVRDAICCFVLNSSVGLCFFSVTDNVPVAR